MTSNQPAVEARQAIIDAAERGRTNPGNANAPTLSITCRMRPSDQL